MVVFLYLLFLQLLYYHSIYDTATVYKSKDVTKLIYRDFFFFTKKVIYIVHNLA